MKSSYCSWCLVRALGIIWIHWKKSSDFSPHTPPSPPHWPWVFPHACMNQHSAKDLRGPLCRSPEFSLCVVLSSLVLCLQIIATSAFGSTSLCLLNSARPQGSVLLPTPCTAAWRPSPGSELGLSFLFFQGL